MWNLLAEVLEQLDDLLEVFFLDANWLLFGLEHNMLLEELFEVEQNRDLNDLVVVDFGLRQKGLDIGNLHYSLSLEIDFLEFKLL